MPCTERSRVEASKSCLLATLIPVMSRFSSTDRCGSKWKGHVASSLADAWKKPAIACVAIFDATSPALWPPIPSATTNRSNSLRIQKLSSLCSLWSPTSVSPAATTFIRVVAPCCGRGETASNSPLNASMCQDRLETSFALVTCIVSLVACGACGGGEPDPRTIPGAIEAALAATDAYDGHALYKLVDQRARRSMCAVIFDRHAARELVTAHYPEETRAP